MRPHSLAKFQGLLEKRALQIISAYSVWQAMMGDDEYIQMGMKRVGGLMGSPLPPLSKHRKYRNQAGPKRAKRHVRTQPALFLGSGSPLQQHLHLPGGHHSNNGPAAHAAAAAVDAGPAAGGSESLAAAAATPAAAGSAPPSGLDAGLSFASLVSHTSVQSSGGPAAAHDRPLTVAETRRMLMGL